MVHPPSTDKQHPLKVIDDIIRLPEPSNPAHLELDCKVKWLPVPTSQLIVEASRIFRQRGAAYRIGIIGDTESKYEILRSLDFDDIRYQTAQVSNPWRGPLRFADRVGLGTEENGLFVGPYLVGRESQKTGAHCGMVLAKNEAIDNKTHTPRDDRARFELFSYPSYYDMPVRCYMYKYKTFAMSLLVRLFTNKLTEKDEELGVFCHHLGIPLAFVHTEGNALSQRLLGRSGKLVAIPPYERTNNHVVGDTNLSSPLLPEAPHSVLSGSGLLSATFKKSNCKATAESPACFLVCAQTLLSLCRYGGRQSCFDELQFLHWILRSLVRKHSWTFTPPLRHLESRLLPLASQVSGTVEEDAEFGDPNCFRIAFAGDQGAGRTSLLNVLFGIDDDETNDAMSNSSQECIQRVPHPNHPEVVGYDLPGRKPGTLLDGFEYFQKYKLNRMSAVLIVYESDLDDGHFTVARACADAGVPFSFVHSKADQGLQHVLTAIPDMKMAVRQMRNEFTCVIERWCYNRGVTRPKIFLISVREYAQAKSAEDLKKCQFDEEALLWWLFSYYRAMHPMFDCPLQVFLKHQDVMESCAPSIGPGSLFSSECHSVGDLLTSGGSPKASSNGTTADRTTSPTEWDHEIYASAPLTPGAVLQKSGVSRNASASEMRQLAASPTSSSCTSPQIAASNVKRKARSMMFAPRSIPPTAGL